MALQRKIQSNSPISGSGQADASQGNWREVGEILGSEISALKNNDDLVTQVVAKYSLDQAKAQGDVDTLMHGRQI